MKEQYFTPPLLYQQAHELYAQVSDIRPGKARPLIASRSALLVLDMQAYFLETSSHAFIPSAEAIVGGILKLIGAFSITHRPVYFSQHVNTKADAGMMSAWWKDVLTSQNPLHRLIPEIDLSLGTLIHKPQYDAFHETPLQSYLVAAGVTQVVVTGVMTHLCCETTARSAFMRGFEVFFPVDGTATYNLAFHRASMLNLAHGFATLTFVDDILQAFEGENGS